MKFNIKNTDKIHIANLKHLLEIQCSDGNWNYDPYMHGLANGLILAIAVIEGTDPQYLDPPNQWLCDKLKTESKPLSIEERAWNCYLENTPTIKPNTYVKLYDSWNDIPSMYQQYWIDKCNELDQESNIR